MPEPTSPPSGPGQRLAWADTAKALSVVLVVLHHTIGKHLGFVFPDGLSSVEEAWVDATYALKPVRMPLFFVVSGLFAGAAVTRPWREVARKRVGNVYYVYALWLVIHMVVFLVLEALPMNRTRNATELAQDLIYASTGLWYLYALVVYFLLSRLIRGVDPRLIVFLAALVALLAPSLPIDEVNRVSLLQHFVYFAFGMHFPTVVTGMARLPRRFVLALVLATIGVVAGLSAIDAGLHTTRFVVSLLAVPLALRSAAALVRWRPVAAAGTFIGARTLAIYVLHMPVLASLHLLLADTVRFGPLGDLSVAASVLYPLVVTGAIVAVCLLVHRMLTLAGLPWLFAWPPGVHRSAPSGLPHAESVDRSTPTASQSPARSQRPPRR